nr:ADP-ribosylglycohydrolase family protein [Pseudomonas sp.]
MSYSIEDSIVRSALWAAYGDILGFPTELMSETDFNKINGRRGVSGPISWERRQGGLFGPKVKFKPGCYSDDTQLRLSTSRAIRGTGYFDVESFAKIELPIWLNYALGAGRGSKAAANNLSLKESTWSLNFFSTEKSVYWQGGGNGAAMRIQPHVWSKYESDLKSIMLDVVRNSVCTHGHPRAIIGAAIHAASLYYTMESMSPPPPNLWGELGADAASVAYDCLKEDDELSLVWIPKWEHSAKRALRDVWADTISEWVSACHTAVDIERNKYESRDSYKELLSALGGFSKAERGSGLKTSLYANYLSWIYKDRNPMEALLVSANAFLSDTDTVGTMAGAIMGVTASVDPDGPIQDENYIRQEALRMARIGAGGKEKSFQYPDLLEWSPPRSQVDIWEGSGKQLKVQGLGQVEPISDAILPAQNGKMEWRWYKLPFGQTILAKRKVDSLTLSGTGAKEPEQQELYSESTSVEVWKNGSIEEIAQHCIKSGFDHALIGEALLHLASGKYGVENSVAFSAIIAMAKMVRNQK